MIIEQYSIKYLISFFIATFVFFACFLDVASVQYGGLLQHADQQKLQEGGVKGDLNDDDCLNDYKGYDKEYDAVSDHHYACCKKKPKEMTTSIPLEYYNNDEAK